MMAGRAQDLGPRSVRPRGLEDRRKGQMPLSPPSFGMVGMACSLARLFLILVVHSADHNDVAKNVSECGDGTFTRRVRVVN